MRGLILVAILSVGCAAPRARPRPPEARRVPDAIPEKAAALRNSDPHQHPEDDEQRWGFEEKRQRDLEQRRRAREKAQQGQGHQGADVSKKAGATTGSTPQAPASPPANPPAQQPQ